MIGVETRPDRSPASVPPPTHTPHTHKHARARAHTHTRTQTHAHTPFSCPLGPPRLCFVQGSALARAEADRPPPGLRASPLPSSPETVTGSGSKPSAREWAGGSVRACVRACLRVSARACVGCVPACVCASALRGQGCRGRRRPSACRRGRVLWRTRAVRGDGGGRRAAFEWRHSCSIQASRCAGGCGDKAPAPLVCAMCAVRQVCDRHSPMDCGGYLNRWAL